MFEFVKRKKIALRASPPAGIVDISGRLGADIEQISGYEGLGWTA